MNAKILIVDDSSTDRMIISHMLSGFQLLTACDGCEAMELIQKNLDIDLIILDLNMPIMDGFEVLLALKSDAQYSQLRTIILTNYDEIENEIKGLHLGAIDYIRKPVNIESLKIRIDIHLELKQAQKKTEQDNVLLDSLVLAKTAELTALSEKLRESEMLFRTIFDQAPIGIAIGHNDNFTIPRSDTFPTINPMFEKITCRTKEELAGISWADITHPDDLPADLANFEKFKSGEVDGYDMEKRYLKPDGSDIWVHMLITPLKLYNNTNYNHLCLIQDISSRKSMEKVLSESERSKSVLLSNLPGMAYRCSYDRDWTMQFVSEGCYALTGYKAENLLYNKDISFNDIIAPEYHDRLWRAWETILSQKSPFRYEYEIIASGGTHKWVLEMGQGVYDEQGKVIALEGIIIDISEQKERELHIQYLNEHDNLTKLYNRNYFEELLSRDLCANSQYKRAVLLVNLKKFNLLILTFGYQFCEKMILECAEKLSLLSKKSSQLFYVSSDRFAFYLKEYANQSELVALCEAIIDTINSTSSLKTVGASIGVVEIDHCQCDAGRVLKNASIAAENACGNQTFGYSFFDDKMEAKIMREADIKNELAKAAFDCEDENLYLNYQPILDLKTNRIYGFEALARCKSEKLGFVSPLEFIPIAEETLLIVPLGKRIMRLAFGFLKQIESIGYTKIKMSVNISAVQLLRDDLLPDLLEVINETKVNPSNLCIEITESAFSNNFQDINEKLEKIKALGISVAIDDFGTGYSSLARERELNVNYLKIDKYFMDKLICLDEKEAITADIISMAHKLGHFVIAEGVETENQKRYLLENNCDCMQGYLFSKPLSQDAAIAILENTNKTVSPIKKADQ